MKTNTLRKILALASVAMFGASTVQAQTLDLVAPSDVSNVVVEDTATDSIKLSWDKATDDVSVKDYKVYYGLSSVQTDGGYYDDEILVGSSKTTYTLKNLQSDKTYYIAVTALDANENESYNYSIEVSAQTEKAEVLHSAPTEEPTEIEKSVEAGSVKAVLSADKVSGSAPLKVKFDATESSQKDGAIASYTWDYNSDGVVDSTLPAPSYTFTESGVYDVSLLVTGTDGKTDTTGTTITVWDTEVVEYIEPNVETEEPVVEDVAEDTVETVAEPEITTEPVVAGETEEDNLPETGPALLIPAIIAGAGALMARRKK